MIINKIENNNSFVSMNPCKFANSYDKIILTEIPEWSLSYIRRIRDVLYRDAFRLLFFRIVLRFFRELKTYFKW